MFNEFEKIVIAAFFGIVIVASIGFALLVSGVIWYGVFNIWNFIF